MSGLYRRWRAGRGVIGVIREPWIGGRLGNLLVLGLVAPGVCSCVRGGWDLLVLSFGRLFDDRTKRYLCDNVAYYACSLGLAGDPRKRRLSADVQHDRQSFQAGLGLTQLDPLGSRLPRVPAHGDMR